MYNKVGSFAEFGTLNTLKTYQDAVASMLESGEN